MLRTNSRFKYPNIPISGAVVIVTGAARGIGAATARLFASRGAAVWLGDVDVDVLADTAASISGSHWARLDVTDAASWKSFADEVNQTSGRIDILVNNAGVMPLGSFLAEAPAIGDLTLAVNLRAPIIGTREVLPQMVKRGLGHIVTIASMAGKMAFPGMAVSNASKFGAVGFSRSMRLEHDGNGVSFSTILPSAVRTELSSGAKLGAGMPTVDPAAVAEAVVKSVSSRKAEIAVPGGVGLAGKVLEVAPEMIASMVRRRLDDRRALHLADAAARQGYADRLDRHAGVIAPGQGAAATSAAVEHAG